MGIIYKIENVITHEVYVGQTKFNLDRRWKQHIKEANEAMNGKRQSFPYFHRMIIKYGSDNFIPTVLEECENSLLDEKENYWIKYYNSFQNGFNSQKGGTKSGTTQKVSEFSTKGEYIKTYDSASDAAIEKNTSASNIRHCCNGDYKTCAGVIWQWGDSQTLKRELPKKFGREKPILQFDKADKFIKEYPSIAAAVRENQINYNSIYNVCRGTQKTAGGYKWKYKEKF